MLSRAATGEKQPYKINDVNFNVCFGHVIHLTRLFLTHYIPAQYLSHFQLTIPYSGFYLRGPNLCEVCEVLTSSQILILKLLLYFREQVTEHVILAPGYPRKTYIARYQSTYGMCPTAVVPLHVATARDHGDFVCHGDKPALLLYT